MDTLHILSDEAYHAAMKSNIPFVVPEPPPLNPDLPTGATVAQITEITRQHTANTRVFNEYRHVLELALKKQLLDNVEPLLRQSVSCCSTWLMSMAKSPDV
jgi:hypothetical protein